MKKRKCYVEASVWNQIFHDDRPDWKEITEIFLKSYKKNNIQLYISEIVIREIRNASKLIFKKLSKKINEHSPIILELDKDTYKLSKTYLKQGIFGKGKENTVSDAEHVAICTTFELDYLVTWNYRHLYKANNMLLFNSVNLQNGYSKSLNIITPEGLIT